MERAAEPSVADRVRALATRWWRAALLVLVLALVAWPYESVTPGVDADWNWHAALAFAAKHGMRFGEEIVWTYGPLGFLVNGPYLYYGDIALLQLAYAWGVQLLLAGTLYLALRRSFAPLVAFAVAIPVLVLVPDRLFALGLAWCALALARGDDAPRDRLSAAFAPAIGVLVGIAALGKLNQGVGLLLLALVALLARPGRRGLDAATFAGAALATAAVGWIASGQTAADVWPYVRYGRELVDGYAAAMGAPHPERPWAPWAAALVACLALVLVLDTTRAAQPRRRLGLLAVSALYAFLAWKQGFVRHAGGIYFGDMLLLLAVLPVVASRRAFALASVAACAVITAASYGAYDLGERLDPYRNARAAAEQGRQLLSRERRGAAKGRLREAILATHALPPAFVGEIGRKPVAFWSYSYGELVYAYDLNWRPIPVLETYAAYTPALDALDARMLASERAPERILRSTLGGLDNRYRSFEAPRAQLEILCRYRPLGAEGQWQLLARGADRCGDERVLSSVEARWEEPVPVPAPSRDDALVLVRVEGAEPAGLERLRDLLLRPEIRGIVLDGTGYRLVAATATEGLLLSAPPDADYAAPFAMAPNAATVAVTRAGGRPGGTLRYTFVEVPIEPLAVSGAR